MEKKQGTDRARVVAYLRTASGRKGITEQRKGIEEFAKKGGITIDEFIELESTRAEEGIILLFQRLHPRDTLIITDFSRLTRQLEDMPEIMDKLKDNKILVTSTNLNMEGSVMHATMKMIKVAGDIAMTECSACQGRFLRSNHGG